MKSLRWIYRSLVLFTVAAVLMRLWAIVRVDGITPLEYFYFALVAILTWWISASFWLAALGAYAQWRGIVDGSLNRLPDGAVSSEFLRSRTALVFPVRNEEPLRLFAGIDAVRESIQRRGASARFDIYVLSDSNSNDHLAAEAEVCRALSEKTGCEVYYRYRRDNEGRKSGNIAEFCRNWGSLYKYMVVLDADSLMTGDTLVRLVGLMEVNPRAALIQSLPRLAGRDSLFARIQQFASSVYGSIYATGSSLLHGPHGNYWGHNAIIRIQPFMRHCGLPKLPGGAPFGGEIMSHDFVEAALLRRAGWNVHLVTDLEGSFEEPPPTLIDHLTRDRRWCQGNLQHIPLLAAQGFRSESRGHFATGVMAYLCSPLWLVTLLVSLVALRQDHVDPVADIGQRPVLAWQAAHTTDIAVLIGVMLVLLLAPKLFALLLLLRDPDARRSHGGAWGLTLSVLLESLFSALLAPIMMLSQSAAVAKILSGEVGGWGVQIRHEIGASLGAVTRAFRVHTLVAVAATGAVVIALPDCAWWFVPVLAGPLLSIPIAFISSSSSVGRYALLSGLFVTPAEVGHVPIVARVRHTLGAGVTAERQAEA